MKLTRKPRLRGNGWNHLFAFLIPCGGMLLLMLINGYHPFGTSAMLYSDNYHQYYPFFVSFRRALLSGDSLLYSWDVGMGVDYLGLIAYYLGEPGAELFLPAGAHQAGPRRPVFQHLPAPAL